jgi:hypothetical protein
MKTFYGVFGASQFHPSTGEPLQHRFVELKAESYDEAEKQMWAAFGANWCFVYEESPVGQPHSSAWLSPLRLQTPAEGATGETVTLRVRISERLAQERVLWVAGRCVAERPGPGAMVHNGAAVWLESNVWPKDWNVESTPSLLGAGEVVHVRYVPRARAERAVLADPQNVSIVEGSESLGQLGLLPDVRPDISGTFTREALDALHEAGREYAELVSEARTAMRRVEEVKSWRDQVVGVELREGKLVGVRVKSR